MSNEVSGRKAFLTGITGQDGSYLAELLLGKGYEVHALAFTPPPGAPTGAGIVGTQSVPSAIRLHEGDLGNTERLAALIAEVRPDELYNLGAQTHVMQSLDNPESAVNITGLGPLRLLEAVRRAGLEKKTRFFQASSAELFGNPLVSPQDENTPIRPRNPYGAAKAFAHWILTQYRETHGMFNCSGILYNHESPRRGEAFVTRKITMALAQMVAGRQKTLSLGDLEARRDWGFAGDYVEGMWMMMQQGEPDDYVLSTGVTHSIREFLDEAFGYAGLDWKAHVEVDPRFVRAPELVPLVGNPTKAREKLGWNPRVDFKGLVRMMVDADFKAAGLDLPQGAA